MTELAPTRPGLGVWLMAARPRTLSAAVSPVLAGQRDDRSFGLIRDIEFGRTPKPGRLLSLRRHESHLFMRYGLSRVAGRWPSWR